MLASRARVVSQFVSCCVGSTPSTCPSNLCFLYQKDFRSTDGLYNLVKQQYPDVVMKGRDLFDASLFRDPTSTSVFYTFISQLKQSVDAATPSPTHAFLKTLDTKKKLLRSYTQNIDGFEERAGLLGSSSDDARVATAKGKSKLKTRDVRNVQLHGDINRVRCTFCSADLPCTEDYLRLFNEGVAPDCPECNARCACLPFPALLCVLSLSLPFFPSRYVLAPFSPSDLLSHDHFFSFIRHVSSIAEARVARSARALKIGTLRPAIVLYDEPHPLGDDIGTIQSGDLAKKPDLLIVMGTSLKVHGLKKLVKEFAKTVHAGAPSTALGSSNTATKPSLTHKVIFVNKTAPGTEWNGIIDYHVEGSTDEWVERVLEQWKRDRPDDWQVQTTLDAKVPGGQKFKASKKGKAKSTSAHIPLPNPYLWLRVDCITCFRVAEGKKAAGLPEPEGENIPPPPATDDAPSAGAHATKPPSSPSKRRHSTSHYSALEASPPKRRSFTEAHQHRPAPPLAPTTATTLPSPHSHACFANTTNSAVDLDADETDTDEELPPTLTLANSKAHGPLRKMRSAPRMNLKVDILMPPPSYPRGSQVAPAPRPRSRSQSRTRAGRRKAETLGDVFS